MAAHSASNFSPPSVAFVPFYPAGGDIDTDHNESNFHINGL